MRRVTVPTTTPAHPFQARGSPSGVYLRAGWVVVRPIPAPFPDVAAHVIEPKFIGGFSCYRMRSARTVCGVPGHVVYGVATAIRVAVCAVAASGGELPFGFGGQAVAVIRKVHGHHGAGDGVAALGASSGNGVHRGEAFEGAQTVAELHCIVPSDIFHWTARTASQLARAVACDNGVLVLSDLSFAHVEGAHRDIAGTIVESATFYGLEIADGGGGKIRKPRRPGHTNTRTRIALGVHAFYREAITGAVCEAGDGLAGGRTGKRQRLFRTASARRPTDFNGIEIGFRRVCPIEGDLGVAGGRG